MTVRPNFLCVDAQRIQSEGSLGCSISECLSLLFQLRESSVGACVISKSHKILVRGCAGSTFLASEKDIDAFSLS